MISPASIAFASSGLVETAGTSFTFTGQAIGAASIDRVVLVGIALRTAGVTAGVVSCTIGGVAATILVAGRDAVTNTNDVAIAALLVPAGATGNIVVSTTVSAVRCHIGVWALTGTEGVVTPVATGLVVVSANPVSNSLLTKGGGAVVAIAIDGSTGATTYTWAGPTKDFNSVNAVNNSWSGAHVNNVAGGNLAVSATYSAAPVEAALVCAAW